MRHNAKDDVQLISANISKRFWHNYTFLKAQQCLRKDLNTLFWQHHYFAKPTLRIPKNAWDWAAHVSHAKHTMFRVRDVRTVPSTLAFYKYS